MALNLVIEQLVRGKIYPALARWSAIPYTPEWRQFEQHWPNTVPFRLQEYFDCHNVGYNVYGITENFPSNSFYPIGLGFFNFDLDYFTLLPVPVFSALIGKRLRLLFYYHEGDNPTRIHQRLTELVKFHKLPHDCYCFISGNTAAKNIANFVYFPDFELWYMHRNSEAALQIHTIPRERDFTVLNRLHKSWRATAMADLHRHNLLNNSYWSYCETGTIIDEDNPIQIDAFNNLRADTKTFLNAAPYISDELTMAERNDHSITESKYFVNAYCNIVTETHFDADQSNGAFITEKTFKPIKHGQPFFIAGCVGSLQTLRDLGYRTFDDVLDNTYDTIVDNTQRWDALRNSIAEVKNNLPNVFKACLPDIIHNQQLFLASKQTRLNTLLEEINEQS